MSNYENLSSNAKEYFSSEIEKINQFLGSLNISRKLSKGTIACIYRMVTIFMNRLVDVEIDENDVFFSLPKKIYDADYLIDCFNNHESLFKVIDLNDDILKNKWYLLDISPKSMGIILRGSTKSECDVLYKNMKNILKNARKANWNGKCKIIRSYELD